jgi:hypothetical protein
LIGAVLAPAVAYGGATGVLLEERLTLSLRIPPALADAGGGEATVVNGYWFGPPFDFGGQVVSPVVEYLSGGFGGGASMAIAYVALALIGGAASIGLAGSDPAALFIGISAGSALLAGLVSTAIAHGVAWTFFRRTLDARFLLSCGLTALAYAAGFAAQLLLATFGGPDANGLFLASLAGTALLPPLIPVVFNHAME